jgi:hypothetical protein
VSRQLCPSQSRQAGDVEAVLDLGVSSVDAATRRLAGRKAEQLGGRNVVGFPGGKDTLI